MQSETQAIAGLFYDGVLQPQAWHAAMDAMCTRLQAGVFHSFTLDESSAPTPESAGNLEQFGLHARHMAEYETQHAGNDPRLAATLRLATGGVMLDHEHFSARQALRNPVYADWLIPLGLKHTAGTAVRLEGSALDIISFMRPRDARPYSADDKRFIERLVPDIARAAKLRARMVTLSRSAHLGMAALDSLRQSIVVVDAQCRIHHANAADERLLALPAGCGAPWARRMSGWNSWSTAHAPRQPRPAPSPWRTVHSGWWRPCCHCRPAMPGPACKRPWRWSWPPCQARHPAWTLGWWATCWACHPPRHAWRYCWQPARPSRTSPPSRA